MSDLDEKGGQSRGRSKSIPKIKTTFWGKVMKGIKSGTIGQHETVENRKVWKMEEAGSEVDDLPEADM